MKESAGDTRRVFVLMKADSGCGRTLSTWGIFLDLFSALFTLHSPQSNLPSHIQSCKLNKYSHVPLCQSVLFIAIKLHRFLTLTLQHWHWGYNTALQSVNFSQQYFLPPPSHRATCKWYKLAIAELLNAIPANTNKVVKINSDAECKLKALDNSVLD